MVINSLVKWYIVTMYCLSNRFMCIKLIFFFKKCSYAHTSATLQVQPMKLWLTAAAEGGIGLPGGNRATWEDGNWWRAERQHPASSSTRCSLPLLPAQQPAQQRSLCRAPCHLRLLLLNTFLVVWPPSPVNKMPVLPMLLRSLNLVCLM